MHSYQSLMVMHAGVQRMCFALPPSCSARQNSPTPGTFQDVAPQRNGNAEATGHHNVQRRHPQ